MFAFGRVELVFSGLACLAIVLFILPLRLSAHWLLLLSVLPLANLSPPRPQSGDLYLRVLDVGQGLSIHLQTRNQDVLYDTGSRSQSGLDSGQTVILPALRLLGVNKLDRLVLSHMDSDHVGGVQTVLRELPVLAITGAGYGGCTPPVQFDADGVYFKVFQVMQTDNDNNSSCLLRITGAGFDILLTGDIEKSAEHELIERSRAGVDLMTVPHHGSQSSSSPALLNHFMPRQAIIASGYQNAFGHPSDSVVQRYLSRHIELVNTATSGSAVYRASTDGVVLVAEALPLQKKFWQYPR
jgi:competence protein ComEC